MQEVCSSSRQRIQSVGSFEYLISHGWDQINIHASEINKR